MSIKNRIEDAQELWKHGKKEGAFLMMLIALAATARKRYPYPKYRDRDSFLKFWQDANPGIVAVEYLGECRPLGEIFYEWIRCQLVHQAELPVDIEFVDNGRSIRAGGAPEFKLLIGYGWINALLANIINAAETDFEVKGTS